METAPLKKVLEEVKAQVSQQSQAEAAMTVTKRRSTVFSPKSKPVLPKLEIKTSGEIEANPGENKKRRLSTFSPVKPKKSNIIDRKNSSYSSKKPRIRLSTVKNTPNPVKHKSFLASKTPSKRQSVLSTKPFNTNRKLSADTKKVPNTAKNKPIQKKPTLKTDKARYSASKVSPIPNKTPISKPKNSLKSNITLPSNPLKSRKSSYIALKTSEKLEKMFKNDSRVKREKPKIPRKSKVFNLKSLNFNKTDNSDSQTDSVRLLTEEIRRETKGIKGKPSKTSLPEIKKRQSERKKLDLDEFKKRVEQNAQIELDTSIKPDLTVKSKENKISFRKENHATLSSIETVKHFEERNESLEEQLNEIINHKDTIQRGQDYKKRLLSKFSLKKNSDLADLEENSGTIQEEELLEPNYRPNTVKNTAKQGKIANEDKSKKEGEKDKNILIKDEEDSYYNDGIKKILIGEDDKVTEELNSEVEEEEVNEPVNKPDFHVMIDKFKIDCQGRQTEDKTRLLTKLLSNLFKIFPTEPFIFLINKHFSSYLAKFWLVHLEEYANKAVLQLSLSKRSSAKTLNFRFSVDLRNLLLDLNFLEVTADFSYFSLLLPFITDILNKTENKMKTDQRDILDALSSKFDLSIDETNNFRETLLRAPNYSLISTINVARREETVFE